MSERFPDQPSEFEAEGIPAHANPDPGLHGESSLEPPHDTALAVDEFGTTAREQHEGEPLSGRLAREEPEVLELVDHSPTPEFTSDTPFAEGAGAGVGRLGAAADPTATEFLVAQDLGADLGGFSAEEAAMHLLPEV